MGIQHFLSPDDVLISARFQDKKSLLKELAGRAASRLGLSSGAVFNEMQKREQLGSTGLGDGVALPHARFAEISKPYGIFARLKRPIDFDAVDGRAVDVVFFLLLPAQADGEQLTALASVARKLR
ncbi:MAG: PTS sugar transporter subunit IIA, partial [Xanthobacteraceae bacterium]